MYVRILLSVCILLIGFCSLAQGTYSSQPEVSARVANVVQVNGLRFKDLNKNGKLDPYEDWRLPVDKRIDDLVQHMTIPEKVVSED